MVISALVAALGLVTNSAAVIIGAMLISPLMTPMFRVSLGLISGDLPLAWRGVVTLTNGVLLAIGAGVVIGLLPLPFEVTPEILARTSPTLLDLFVAIFAGTAGCLAIMDERISPVLPGIAIATSLVPPLSASGLCFALGAPGGGFGAFMRFFANLVAILIVSSILYAIAGLVSRKELGSSRQVLRRLSSVLISLFVVFAVLSYSLQRMVAQMHAEQTIERVVRAITVERPATTFHDAKFKLHQSSADVLIVLRTAKAVTPAEAKALEKALEEGLRRDTRLVVRNQIVVDVSATDSMVAVVEEDLDGEFITEDLPEKARRVQMAEQQFREILEKLPGVYLRDLSLIDVDRTPVLVASMEGTGLLTASEVGNAERMLKARLNDPAIRLVVRAEDIVGITRKGRILLGEAHLETISEQQMEVESEVRAGIEDIPEMVALSIDAVSDTTGWRVRAKVMGPRAMRPGEVTRIEESAETSLGVAVELDIWMQTDMFVSRDGYAPRTGFLDDWE